MRLLVKLFIISVISTFVMSGFTRTNELPDVHDPTIAYRTQIFIDSLSAGQFPPAWHNSLNYGHGYPLNLYYAPLITILTSVTTLITKNIVSAVKITLSLITFFGMWGVSKILNKYNPIVSVMAAVAFALLPYHASALYVRGSYAEYLALNIIPWVLYYWTVPLSNNKNIAKAVIMTFLLLISHNTLPFIALPAVFLVSFLIQKENLKQIIMVTILSFMLSAAFLMPALLERGLIQVDYIANQTVLTDHFVFLRQLWYSPWGYGGSAPGISDLMSFMLGKGQVILAIIGLAVMLHKKDKYALLTTLPLISLLILALPISRGFWELLPSLSILQFPWRVIGIATIGISLAVGLAFALIKNSLNKILAILMLVGLVATNYVYFKPWNKLTYNHDILTSKTNLYPLVANKIPEYLPAWMPKFPTTEPNDGLTRNITSVTGQIENQTLQTITIQTAYMPHWKLTLNGYPTDIVPNQDGTIRTHAVIPPGKYEVNLVWHKTPLEKFGILLSLIAVSIVLGLSL